MFKSYTIGGGEVILPNGSDDETGRVMACILAQRDIRMRVEVLPDYPDTRMNVKNGKLESIGAGSVAFAFPGDRTITVQTGPDGLQTQLGHILGAVLEVDKDKRFDNERKGRRDDFYLTGSLDLSSAHTNVWYEVANDLRGNSDLKRVAVKEI